jgi:hypothetical protein
MIMDSLKQAGGRLHNTPARDRFLLQAVSGLAESGLGPDGWLERQLFTGRSTLSSFAISDPTAQGDFGGMAI